MKLMQIKTNFSQAGFYNLEPQSLTHLLGNTFLLNLLGLILNKHGWEYNIKSML